MIVFQNTQQHSEQVVTLVISKCSPIQSSLIIVIKVGHDQGMDNCGKVFIEEGSHEPKLVKKKNTAGHGHYLGLQTQAQVQD